MAVGIPCRRILPRTGERGRRQLYGSVLQQAFEYAAPRVTIPKMGDLSQLRHSFPRRPHELDYYLRAVQELPEHGEVITTIIHTHIRNRKPAAARASVDQLMFTLGGPGCQAGAAQIEERRPDQMMITRFESLR